MEFILYLIFLIILYPVFLFIYVFSKDLFEGIFDFLEYDIFSKDDDDDYFS